MTKPTKLFYSITKSHKRDCPHCEKIIAKKLGSFEKSSYFCSVKQHSKFNRYGDNKKKTNPRRGESRRQGNHSSQERVDWGEQCISWKDLPTKVSRTKLNASTTLNLTHYEHTHSYKYQCISKWFKRFFNKLSASWEEAQGDSPPVWTVFAQSEHIFAPKFGK